MIIMVWGIPEKEDKEDIRKMFDEPSRFMYNPCIDFNDFKEVILEKINEISYPEPLLTFLEQVVDKMKYLTEEDDWW